MKCSFGISNFLEEISILSQSIVFLYLFLCTDHWGRLSYLSLLFFGSLHSNGNIFPFLVCFSLLFFSQLFVSPPHRELNSPCSFEVSMIGFNPSLTSGFRKYCFLCGNMCGFLSLTTTGIAFCAQPTVFPSTHTLGFTFCSVHGRESRASIFMKTEAMTCSVYPSLKGVKDTLSWSETRVKTAQSPAAA